MAEESRRIVAILVADVPAAAGGVVAAASTPEPVDAAALDATVEVPSAALIVQGLLQKHGGEQHQEMGDARLFSFSTAAAAVDCALDLVRELDDSQPQARFGVHFGQLVFREAEDQTEVFGDACRAAARIREIAAPGSVCVSEPVFATLRDARSGIDFESLGTRQLKNVNRPMLIYRVVGRREGVPLGTAARDVENAQQPSVRRWRLPAAVAGAAALAGVAAWLLVSSSSDEEPMPIEDTPAVVEVEPEPPVVDLAAQRETRQRADFARVRGELIALAGPGDFGARVWTVPDPVKDGSFYHVGFEADCDCTALLFAVDGSSAEITLLYPNPYEPEAHVGGGEPTLVPSTDAWRIRAVGGEGIDVLKLIVVSGAVDFPPDPTQAWAATPEEPVGIASLTELLAALEASSWDAATAPLQITP